MWGPIDIYAKAGTAGPSPLVRFRPSRPQVRCCLILPSRVALGTSPIDRIHVLPVLEEENAGDRTDVEPHRRPLVRVHVHLGDLGPADILAGELVQHRRHDLARPAPRRPEIHQYQPVGLLDLAANEASLTCTVKVFVAPMLLFSCGLRAVFITYRRRNRVAEGPRIAHVGIAVPDLEQALPFYREVLGLEPHPPEVADGATILSLPFGDSEVELLAPLRRTDPIAKFLARRGPGIHHICYRVPDLDAALERLPRGRLSAGRRSPSIGGRRPPDRLRASEGDRRHPA